MHIKFESENIIVDNLQIFLKENFDKHLQLSGVYDSYTHDALVNYLKQPNTLDVRDVKTKIIEKFTYRNSTPPYGLAQGEDGGGIYNFDNTITLNTIIFKTKPNHIFFDNGVRFINNHINELKEFVKNYGWTVTSYTSYKYDPTVDSVNYAEIVIEKTGIYNYFPNSSLLPMINIFDGNYIYAKCFISSSTYTGFISYNKNYKIALIPCKSGEIYTITHGYSVACEMAVSFTTLTSKQLKQEGAAIGNKHILNRMSTSIQGAVDPGEWFYYKIPEDSNATYLVIQMPYRSDMLSTGIEKVKVKLGDINLDGVVDQTDVNLLNSYVTALENNSTPPFELTGNSLIAANLNKDLDLDGNPIIDRNDVAILQAAVNNNRDLGYVEFEQAIKVSAYEQDRLLVIYGDDAKDEKLNIPVGDFYIEPWAVHEKFIEYFLGRTIHKYSDIVDIEWLQSNISNYSGWYDKKYFGTYDDYTNYKLDESIRYDEFTGKWVYYVGNSSSGYYLDTVNNFENCFLRYLYKDDNHNAGEMSDMQTIDGKLYKQNKYTGKIILNSGDVVKEGYQHSLKYIVQSFQLYQNEIIERYKTKDDKIPFTNGDYCVLTDKYFTKTYGDNIVYDYGAFK